MNECIIPKNSTDFPTLIQWMEQNVGPCVWWPKSAMLESEPYAEGTNWFVITRINPDDGHYKVIITDYTIKVDQLYTELRLRWG